MFGLVDDDVRGFTFMFALPGKKSAGDSKVYGFITATGKNDFITLAI